MIKPERRTKADVAAAALIALVVALAAAVIWWNSDARATVSHPAAGPATEPTPATQVPARLTQLWATASPATRRPIVVAGNIVTGDGHQMTGRDPATGAVRWSYARDRDLCAVTWIYRDAVAVYPDSRGCGQVSTIDASTGQRGPARSGYADKDVTVSGNGSAVLSYGRTRLEMWRFDMVRMLSYGETDAPVKPSARPVGTGCRLLSAAAGTSAAAVLESCPNDADVRLTLLRPQDGKDEDEPRVRYVPQPGVGADAGAKVLAVAGTNTAVYLPSPQPRVEVIDDSGVTVASILLAQPPSAANAVGRAGDLFTWWTGDAVLVFDGTTLHYRYTVEGLGPAVPLGPATMMANRLLIPVAGGVGVYDAATGRLTRYLPVNRPPGAAAVIPAVSGSLLFEQRGDTVVALG